MTPVICRLIVITQLAVSYVHVAMGSLEMEFLVKVCSYFEAFSVKFAHESFFKAATNTRAHTCSQLQVAHC